MVVFAFWTMTYIEDLKPEARAIKNALLNNVIQAKRKVISRRREQKAS
jgi:hypothetical protein